MATLLHEPATESLCQARLQPDEPLRLDVSAAHTIHVLEGAIYARLEDDDIVLMAGDRLAIRPGELHRIWNATDLEACLIIA